MLQNKPTKDQVFKYFEQWVQTHHPEWVEATRRQYITDAHRILFTDECLPGWGYRTVWHYITQIAPGAKSLFGDSVKERFQKKKSDCPSQWD